MLILLLWCVQASAQPAPTTAVVTLTWDCIGTCLNGATFTLYRQIDCTGALLPTSTVAAPARSIQVSSSLLRNTCWYITVQNNPPDESLTAEAVSYPIALLGGFPILLQWTAPVAGTTPVSYRVSKQLICTGGYVSASVIAPPLGPLLTQNLFSLVSVDNQETIGENGVGTQAIDGNTATIWHTEWSQSAPPHPHTIIIDLAASYQVDGFKYLPRQDGSPNGTIAGYNFSVSTDGSTWGAAVAAGTFAANTAEKTVRFLPKIGQYVRLIATSEINGNPWASAAEINVFGTSGVASVPLAYVILPPVHQADCWHVTAIASDDSEGTATTPFQVPSTIMGGSNAHRYFEK